MQSRDAVWCQEAHSPTSVPCREPLGGLIFAQLPRAEDCSLNPLGSQDDEYRDVTDSEAVFPSPGLSNAAGPEAIDHLGEGPRMAANPLKLPSLSPQLVPGTDCWQSKPSHYASLTC